MVVVLGRQAIYYTRVMCNIGLQVKLLLLELIDSNLFSLPLKNFAVGSSNQAATYIGRCNVYHKALG